MTGFGSRVGSIVHGTGRPSESGWALTSGTTCRASGSRPPGADCDHPERKRVLRVVLHVWPVSNTRGLADNVSDNVAGTSDDMHAPSAGGRYENG